MVDERSSSSDPRKLKDQGARSKDRDKQDAEDLQHVLSTPQGRRFVRGLLADCGEHRSSFHTNAQVTAFNEGGRNIGLKLKSRIVKASPEWLAELLAADPP